MGDFALPNYSELIKYLSDHRFVLHEVEESLNFLEFSFKAFYTTKENSDSLVVITIPKFKAEFETQEYEEIVKSEVVL